MSSCGKFDSSEEDHYNHEKCKQVASAFSSRSHSSGSDLFLMFKWVFLALNISLLQFFIFLFLFSQVILKGSAEQLIIKLSFSVDLVNSFHLDLPRLGLDSVIDGLKASDAGSLLGDDVALLDGQISDELESGQSLGHFRVLQS